jgi:hypothetical protein
MGKPSQSHFFQMSMLMCFINLYQLQNILCKHYEQQMSENYCQSLTNPQLVGKSHNNYNRQLAKVGRHRETTESPEASSIPSRA